MNSKTLRDHSRTQYTSEHSTIENMNAGSLQRIADSTEKMAAGFDAILKKLQQTEKDLGDYRKLWHNERERLATRDRTIANLRGQITKLKNKLSYEQEARPAGGLPAGIGTVIQRAEADL